MRALRVRCCCGLNRERKGRLSFFFSLSPLSLSLSRLPTTTTSIAPKRKNISSRVSHPPPLPFQLTDCIAGSGTEPSLETPKGPWTESPACRASSLAFLLRRRRRCPLRHHFPCFRPFPGLCQPVSTRARVRKAVLGVPLRWESRGEDVLARVCERERERARFPPSSLSFFECRRFFLMISVFFFLKKTL